MRRGITLFAIALALTLIVAGVVSQLASSQPDGLEYVAEQEGFLDAADEHALADSPLADYGSGDREKLVISGVVGVLVTLGIGFLVFSVAKQRKTPAKK